MERLVRFAHGNTSAMRLMLAAMLCMAITGRALAQEQKTAPATPATEPATSAGQLPKPVVSEAADKMLRAMGAYLGSAEQFTFHADITFDHVLPSGQKLQYSASEDVALQRPDGLYVEWGSDLGNRQFWYDGKSITVYDTASPYYASAMAASSVDGMLEEVNDQFGFLPPLADFLYRDPYDAMHGKIQYGTDLGTTQVGGKACRSFAFVERHIDWQIWVLDGPQLTPCRLVITYKIQPAKPQFSATFSDWDFAPRIAKSTFTPVLSPGVQKVPLKNASMTN